jgi:hypothetical protein
MGQGSRLRITAHPTKPKIVFDKLDDLYYMNTETGMNSPRSCPLARNGALSPVIVEAHTSRRIEALKDDEQGTTERNQASKCWDNASNDISDFADSKCTSHLGAPVYYY